MNISEILGIGATTFIVLGFCFKKVNTIRMLNMVGSIMFIIYGLMIGATYTWIANGILFCINAIYIIKSYLSKKDQKDGHRTNSK